MKKRRKLGDNEPERRNIVVNNIKWNNAMKNK